MLVDTNILLRTLQPHHPVYAAVQNAISVLPEAGKELHVAPQNLVEFWAVATRPTTANGLGLTIAEAQGELAHIKSMFLLLPESAAIHPLWERLVVNAQVSGKSAHDARLVAAMQVYGLTEVLTLDPAGFARYPGIAVVDPREV